MTELSKATIYKRLGIALVINIVCISAILYIFGFIEIKVLQNVYFKTLITSIVAILFLYSIYGFFKNNFQRRYFVLYAITFEILGYWWLESLFGYALIILGLFLIPTFFRDWLEVIKG